MLPFLKFKKTYVVKKGTYQLFNSINDLDLSKGITKTNAFDLIATVESSDPLIMKFESSKNDIGFGYSNVQINAILFARFESIDKQTKIDIELKSNILLLIIMVILGLTFFINLIQRGFDGFLILGYILIFLVFMGLDLYVKSSVLSRFENLIYSR